MLQVSIRLDIDEYGRYLQEMPAHIRNAIGNAIKKSAYLVEREAKLETPVDTGRMRASIFSDIQSEIATVSPYVNYALFVHEGTRYIRANPFMKRGLENAQSGIQGFFDDEIDRAINSNV